MKKSVYDMNPAQRWLQGKKAIRTKDADAMYEIGQSYDNIFTKNPRKAVVWLQRAADLGHAKAMCELASYYLMGRGTKRDTDKAVELYQRSAHLGNTEAMRRLGQIYETGAFGRKDINQAIAWHIKAADLEDTTAMRWLAFHYWNGDGREEAQKKGRYWLQKAASLGDFVAVIALELGYSYCMQIGTDAVKCCKESADGGNTVAMRLLGDYYIEHDGWFYIDHDREKGRQKGVEWYQRAAALGDCTAMYKLGNCYKDGIGVEENIETAIYWYQKVAHSNNSVANELLSTLYEQEMIVKDTSKERKEIQKHSILENFFAEYRQPPIETSSMAQNEEWKAETQQVEITPIDLIDPEQQKCASEESNIVIEIELKEDSELLSCNECDNTVTEEAVVEDSELLPCHECDNTVTEEAVAEDDVHLERVDHFAQIYFLEEQVLRLKEENDATTAAYEQERQIKEALMSENAYLRKNREGWQDEFREILQNLETKVHTIGEQAEKIEVDVGHIKKDAGQIKEDVRGLVLSSCVRDNLVASIRKDMADLYTSMEGIANPLEKERKFSARLVTISEGINTQINASQELVRDEQKHLKALFGKGWGKLLPISQTSLISAGVLWKSCADIEEESFDFSGICISVTSALEAEIKKYFFEDFQTYLKEKYGAPSTQNWEQSFEIWPDILLSISKADFVNLQRKYEKSTLKIAPPYISLKNSKHITLGFLPYLFGLKVSKHLENNTAEKERYLTVLRKRLNEYLATILKDRMDEPIDLFLKRIGNKNFIDRCEHVRYQYRNPSAHTDVISKDMARDCYQEVVGKFDVYEYSTNVTSLLLELISMVK